MPLNCKSQKEKVLLCSVTYPGTHRQVGRIWTQLLFEFLEQRVQSRTAMRGKSTHDQGMIGPWDGKSSHGDVAVADRFDFKDSHLSRDGIKFKINRFEQGKNGDWFSHTGPCRKSHQITKHDGRFGEEIGNRFGMIVIVVGNCMMIIFRERCGTIVPPFTLR